MTARRHYLGTVHLADPNNPDQQATVNPDGSLIITQIGSAATGGLSTLYLSAGASTNITVVKAAPAKLFKVRGFLNSSTPIWLKTFNKATAPVLGVDTVFDKWMLIGGANGAGFIDDIELGQAYPIGLSFALTANFADSDVAAVSAGVASITMLFL